MLLRMFVMEDLLPNPYTPERALSSVVVAHLLRACERGLRLWFPPSGPP